MPFRIDKVNDKYKLFNISKKKYVNKIFNTKDSAINSGKNYMNYRNEKNIYVKNNLILQKKNISK